MDSNRVVKSYSFVRGADIGTMELLSRNFYMRMLVFFKGLLSVDDHSSFDVCGPALQADKIATPLAANIFELE